MGSTQKDNLVLMGQIGAAPRHQRRSADQEFH